jgi:hypothetical protein
MCTVLLPPGVNQIAVNKYVISYTVRKGQIKPTRTLNQDSYISPKIRSAHVPKTNSWQLTQMHHQSVTTAHICNGRLVILPVNKAEKGVGPTMCATTPTSSQGRMILSHDQLVCFTTKYVGLSLKKLSESVWIM